MAREMQLELARRSVGCRDDDRPRAAEHLPDGQRAVFTAALGETVGIDRPPPKGFSDRATTFAALDTFAGNNFFTEGIQHRLVILFTDGETAPYFGGDLPRVAAAEAAHELRDRALGQLAASGSASAARLDRAYRPDPAAAHATAAWRPSSAAAPSARATSTRTTRRGSALPRHAAR